jgi:phage anti-repressor protein
LGAVSQKPPHLLARILWVLGQALTISPLGSPALRCWPAFRHFQIGGIVYKCVDVEALLPLCRNVRGGEHLTRFLLQCVLPPSSATQALGLNERVPQEQFTTAGKFVSQRFYSPRVGEIGAIVAGTTVWLSAASIARIRGVSEATVIQLAGPANFLRVPGKFLSTPINPDKSEVYVQSEAVTGVFQSGTSLGGLAKEIEDWIDDNLLSGSKLRKAGAVVNLRGVHRVLDLAADFDDWIIGLVGPARAPLYFSSYSDFIPVTIAKSLVRESRYRNGIVWQLLKDGGVCHGGRVGESADEALVRIQPVFPDGNGQVSARALHQFLRRKRCFESWLEFYSDQPHAGKAGVKSGSRVRSDVLLSEEAALALLCRSFEDPTDIRTTLTPSTKL